MLSKLWYYGVRGIPNHDLTERSFSSRLSITSGAMERQAEIPVWAYCVNWQTAKSCLSLLTDKETNSCLNLLTTGKQSMNRQTSVLTHWQLSDHNPNSCINILTTDKQTNQTRVSTHWQLKNRPVWLVSQPNDNLRTDKPVYQHTDNWQTDQFDSCLNLMTTFKQTKSCLIPTATD